MKKFATRTVKFKFPDFAEFHRSTPIIIPTSGKNGGGAHLNTSTQRKPSSKPSTGGCCHSPEGNFNCNDYCDYPMGGLDKEDLFGIRVWR